MVTTTEIRCVVVVATPENEDMNNRLPAQYRLPTEKPKAKPRFRPSDLVPWADPHIRSLVEQLQEEVRTEKQQRLEQGTRLSQNESEIFPPAAESIVDDLFSEDWFSSN